MTLQMPGTGCQVRSPARLIVFAAIALTVFTLSHQVHASDRDTPAYMVYVDPITGKYSTKPPEDGAGATASAVPSSNNSGAASGLSPTTIDNKTSSTPSGPLLAILLLTGAAFVSLLLKGKQNF